MRPARWWLGLSTVCLCACAGSVPLPPVTDHAGERPVLVPYPPPAVRAEVIPPRPAVRGVVWIDGQWQWDKARWEWREGRWEIAATGAAYAPPQIDYLPAGKIAYHPGRWRPAKAAR